VIDFRRYWWIFRSESRDALSHRQYKGAQVATISRLRKREGRQTGGSASAGASRASAGTASSHKNRLYTLVLSFLSKGCGEAADILAAQLRISGNEQLHLPGQHRARLLCASQCSLPKSVKAASQGRRRCHRRSVPKPLRKLECSCSTMCITAVDSTTRQLTNLCATADRQERSAHSSSPESGCRMHTWWVRQDAHLVGQTGWAGQMETVLVQTELSVASGMASILSGGWDI
jgi:hypothetical protein